MFHRQRQKVTISQPTDFWPGCFNARMDTVIRHFHGNALRFGRADQSFVLDMLDQARQSLPLASRADVATMLAKNPDIIRQVCEAESDTVLGLFAYLPLNAYGAWAVMRGQYNGARPDPAWITRPDEAPVALAIWLILAPGQLGRILEPIATLFRKLQPAGCVIFSHGATGMSAALQRSLGFRPAVDFFPDAPANLMAARPYQGIALETAVEKYHEGTEAKVEVKIARTIEDVTKIFSVRSATYQAEQDCPYDEEFDGNDFCATQFLATVGADAAGCIRVRYFGEFAKLERLAIRREYRRRRLSAPLVDAALQHCARKGFTRVYGHSRADLVGFWQGHGFTPIPDRPSFRFSGVDYVEIQAVLEPDPAAIRLGVNPMISIRPEGYWDDAGPLDLSLLRSDARAATP